MLKYIIFLFLVIAAWAYVLWSESGEGEEVVSQPSTQSLVPISAKKRNLVPPKRIKESFSKKNLKILKTPPKFKKSSQKDLLQKKYKDLKNENLAEFKVDNGKVVAFGDVLLGETEEKIKGGFTYMEPLQYWVGGVIPYGIDEKVEQKEIIEEVISYLNEKTILKFVPYTGQKDYLVFTSGEKHCYSYLGKIGGGQPIFLSPICQRGSILHEIMHALGFIHEHSRTDRDAFVEVLWENIKEDFHPQFAYASDRWMEIYERMGTPFDYKSIMIYQKEAFAQDPQRGSLESLTSQAIKPEKDVLSRHDLARIRYLYGR